MKDMQVNAPPLGIKPRFVILHERKDEILDGIKRFSDVNHEIPIQWIVELNDIMKELKTDGY